MTSHDDNARDEAEFELFLSRQGALAQQLQSLDQPAPSAALDAAILANAQRGLTTSERLSRAASNDALVPGASPSRPAFFRRWQAPVGLAASVAVAVLVMLQWQQGGTDAPLQIAHAPQAQVTTIEPVLDAAPAAPPSPPFPEAEQAAPAAPVAQGAKKQAEIPPKAGRVVRSAPPAVSTQAPAAASAPSAAPPLVIAQAEIPNESGHVLRSAPPAAVASAPAAEPAVTGTQAKAVAKYPAKPWLELIEELWKADLRRDAQEEWKQFRQSYPTYPVPEKLKKELDRPIEK